jgi:uncharacterized protein YbcI
MKSQGEIEAAVCDGIARFHQEFIGRGPKDIHSHLLGSLLVVRLQGALTAAERQLLAWRPESLQPDGNGRGETGPAANDHGNGRALLKQVRSHMIASGRPRLETIVEGAVGVKLVSVHHDISTVTGEEVIVITLAATPTCRDRKRR